MSNPRGGAYMKSRIKGNQDIKETVEAHMNKKGRSKSRRQGAANQNRTIDDYQNIDNLRAAGASTNLSGIVRHSNGDKQPHQTLEAINKINSRPPY